MPKVYSPSEFLSLKFPSDEDIIDNGVLFPTGRLLLAGFHKVGKTILTNQLACDLATGNPFLDRFIIPRPVRVLLVQVELAPRAFQPRYKKVSRWYFRAKRKLEQNLRIVDDENFDIEQGPNRDFLERLEFHPDVIIFDPFYLLHSKNENQSHELTPILRLMDRMIREMNAGLVISHHLRKPGKDKNDNPLISLEIRGSTVLPAWTDTIIVAEPIGPDRVILTTIGRNIVEPVDPIYLFLDRDELRFHVVGNDHSKLEDIVLDHLAKHRGKALKTLLCKEIEEKRNVKYNTIWRAVQELKVQGLILETGETFRLPWKPSWIGTPWESQYMDSDEEEDES